MLELKDVKKYYDSTLVLEISTLRLESGIYWVKGTNGSGKTTLLKMIGGLLPFEGDILFNNISIKNKPASYRQQISWAEAEPLFPSFMTGIDLVRFYGTVRKVARDEIDELIELFNMAGYVDKAIGTYSAGMTKKLSLVLAFLGNSSLIILDEPLITLDIDTYNLTCSYIAEKNKKTGISFLMSSHLDPEKELVLSGKELIVTNRTIKTNELLF